MPARLIIGNIQQVTGEASPGGFFVVAPVDPLRAVDADTIMIGESKRVVADGSGDVSFTLEEGLYTIIVTTSAGNFQRRLRVDSEGPWTLGRLLGIPEPIAPSIVQQVFAAASAAADSAAEAALYDGKKVDTFDELDALTSAQIDVGDLVRVIETGAVYERVASDEDFTTAGGIGVRVLPTADGFVDLHFGALANSSADQTAIYQNIAARLPEGATMIIKGAGNRIISDTVSFLQNGLRVVFANGAVIKRADSTPGLDVGWLFSGHDVKIERAAVDANLTGNPTTTGRCEMIRITGNFPVIDGINIRNIPDVVFAAGLDVRGIGTRIFNVTGDNIGRAAVNLNGDYEYVSGVYLTNLFGVSGKGLVKDKCAPNGPSGSFNRLEIVSAYFQKSLTVAGEAILVDHDGVQGGRVICRDIEIDFPNQEGPDCIKFAYVDDVEIDGLYTRHTGLAPNSYACLRFQEGIKRVSMRRTNLAGGIAFNTENEVETIISGDCRFGRTNPIGSMIFGYPGGLIVVEDGARVDNLTSEMIKVGTTAQAVQTRIRLGAMVANGDDDTARFIVGFSFGSTGVRFSAGQVSVKSYLKSSGMRTLAGNARWVGGSDAQDASVLQEGKYLVSPTDFSDAGPRDTNGWTRGDIIYPRAPAAGSSPAYRVCITAGASCQTAWVGSTAYVLGAWVFNGANVYRCTTAGTSAASGGPTGTGTGIADGSAEWAFVAVKAVFKGVGSVAA